MITFQSEDLVFNLKEKRKHKHWLLRVAKEEGKSITELAYVFCSDTYLLDINQTYLNHDTLTDIVTFDQSEKPNTVEGDIFISLDRVRENAEKFSTQDSELKRVMVHGLLHLLGYKDKAKSDKETMTLKENYYLERFD